MAAHGTAAFVVPCEPGLRKSCHRLVSTQPMSSSSTKKSAAAADSSTHRTGALHCLETGMAMHIPEHVLPVLLMCSEACTQPAEAW